MSVARSCRAPVPLSDSDPGPRRGPGSGPRPGGPSPADSGLGSSCRRDRAPYSVGPARCGAGRAVRVTVHSAAAGRGYGGTPARAAVMVTLEGAGPSEAPGAASMCRVCRSAKFWPGNLCKGRAG
eukprot:229344-Hanusia_phi.AAC.1